MIISYNMIIEQKSLTFLSFYLRAGEAFIFLTGKSFLFKMKKFLIGITQ